MKREDDLELWDLLGKAPTPKLSPFFARNVVRQIREEKSWRDYVRGWFSPRTLIPASAVALTMLVATVSVHFPARDSSSSDNLPDTIAKIDPQDYETVADMDDLIASDDEGLWNESESSPL